MAFGGEINREPVAKQLEGIDPQTGGFFPVAMGALEEPLISKPILKQGYRRGVLDNGNIVTESVAARFPEPGSGRAIEFDRLIVESDGPRVVGVQYHPLTPEEAIEIFHADNKPT